MSESWTGWTDQKFEQAKQWRLGLRSSSWIAIQLGCTRNAVIGKLKRKHVPGVLNNARPSSSPRVAAQREDKKRQRVARAGARAQRKERPKKESAGAKLSPISIPGTPIPEPEPEDLEIPLEQRCQISGLTGDNCHYPIGDPQREGFFFCGGKAVKGSPYCGYHRRVAYRPAAGIDL